MGRLIETIAVVTVFLRLGAPFIALTAFATVLSYFAFTAVVTQSR